MADGLATASRLCVGARLSLTITDIAFGGEGVGRVEDFVVFVPFVLVGEVVEVEVMELKKQFARARLVRVVQAAAERTTPRCRYFGACGGCQYQHMDYAAQLRVKHKQIFDLLQRVGGFARPDVAPVAPCPQPYGYRNRLMVRSQWNKPAGRLDIGFLRHDSRLLVDVEECVIAEPVLNEQLRQVRARPPPKGGVKVVLRVAPEGWELPRDSFFQTNRFLLPELVQTVRARVRGGGVRYLVDVYCGVGFFALELADLVESFVGVECDRAAVHAARRNAEARQRRNGVFLNGAAEALLPEVLGRFPREATAVILDPPRAGCRPACLQALRAMRPRQVLYVSCHPATLARDLRTLCRDAAYELASVTPLDMFPQTQHVECVADLRAPH